MDFYQIRERSPKNGELEIFPDFKVCRSKDLMVRGKAFYAVWDEELGLWSTDEYDVQRIVDRDLQQYFEQAKERTSDHITVKWMSDFSTKSWEQFRKYITHISDNSKQLDEKLTFLNTEVKKSDYVSKRLPYSLEKGECPSYERLIQTLYSPDERAKIEWAVGSILSGDSKKIQKFCVFYGEAGTGKSTILNIVQQLFDGYYITFDAKSLGAGSGSQFATEHFRSNPLVGIQHDGDLSRIEDNTKINSIVAHEEININEKYKAGYSMRLNCMLFMGTNKPVKITDSKSGIIRRLIDVHPTGNKIPAKEYHELMAKIPFELGSIAQHCLDVYSEMGFNYYNAYRPFDMIEKTDVFFNFMEEHYDIFVEQDGATLTQAWQMYKTYCEEASLEFKLPKYKFREEMKNYFREFYDRIRVEDDRKRNYYQGFLKEKFEQGDPILDTEKPSLELDHSKSIFDEEYGDCPAQYAKDDGTPLKSWDKVTTKLKDLDTTKLHYVLVPENHIVIDFDIRDEKGEKSRELNLEAASMWPGTYAEFSKSEAGVHLHYIFDGDVNRLCRIFSEYVEIKVFTGRSSLRRQLTRCNRCPISHISSGLPLKGAKMINKESVKSEKKLRELIERNLHKDIHPATKPSIDFINKLLEDAYNSGMTYDVSDLSPRILAFANNSTHQSEYCVRLVAKMKFKSETKWASVGVDADGKMIFFDVEVYPNLFHISWKYPGDDQKCVRMVNPTPAEMEKFLEMALVGFNCLRYDNPICYARYIGYTNEQLYQLSRKIIDDEGRNVPFNNESRNISYTDIYDFSSAANKKSLKKWEIQLGIHHQEMDIPWDQPVPEEKWPLVGDYCDNDVIAEEKVFYHLKGDWIARQILADLADMTVNDTTNRLTTEIIFGDCPNPQDYFNYRDLSKPVIELPTEQYNFLKKHFPDMLGFDDKSLLPYFPGYEFKNGQSLYKDQVASEGGFVCTTPGIWYNVGLLDIASMHPTSMLCEYLFGKYTESLWDLVQGRIDIKHADVEVLNILFDGKLMKYIEQIQNGEITWKELSNALKTAINSIYGLTSAKFPNAFNHPCNVDNIVAKRGALFMIDLKEAVEKKGWIVAHIKTDSIKIPDITPEKIEFVMNFGKRYGYTFEHEDTYQRMCLVNKACYICVNGKGEWSATAAQFAHPYVFKTLFSKEPIEFKDLCETKSVKTAMYLDMNEDVIPFGDEPEHDRRFVGKVGSFCPIKSGCGGGELVRINSTGDKYGAVTGTKGYRWLEAEVVKELHKEDDIDMSYFNQLATEAIETIEQFGNFDNFISGEYQELREDFMNAPFEEDEENPFK